MKNFICAIFLSFLLFAITCYADVPSSIAESVKTDLMLSHVSTIHFTEMSFKNKLFRFSVYPLRKDGRSIDISIGSSDGMRWTENREVIGHPGTEMIHVYSTFVINNELYLFFYAGKNYMTKTDDGIHWDLLLETFKGDFSNTITTSGYPVDLYGNGKKYIFVCTRMVKDAHKHKTRKGECAFSSDKGKTWMMKYVHLTDEYIHSYILKIFYHNGSLHALVTSDDGEKKYVFGCSESSNRYILCGTLELKYLKNYEIMNVSSTFGYLTMILKSGDDYFRSVSYDGKRADDIEQIPNGQFHEIITTDNYSGLILYETGTDIFMIRNHYRFHDRKAGCQATENYGKNNLYTHRFYPTSKKFSCYINYTECEDLDDGEFKTFYALIPASLSIDEDCFNYNYLGGVIEKSNTQIIKIKQTLKGGRLGNFKEIQFYFPTSHANLFFNKNTTRCSTTNGKYVISFSFNNIKRTTRINSEFKTNDESYDLDTSYFSLYDVTTHPLNGPIESKHMLNAGDFINFSSRLRSDKPENFKLPNGSYLISSKGGVSKFMISNYIPRNVGMEYSQTYQGITKITKMDFADRGDIIPYIGYDFTNTSPNYVYMRDDIHWGPYKVVLLTDFYQPQILGLVCPNNNLVRFTCFDEVIDQHSRIVKIDSLFGKNSVFLAPKIFMTSEKENYVIESRLYLNSQVVDEMIEKKAVVSFSCRCAVKENAVAVKYIIAPTYTEEYIHRKQANGTLNSILGFD